MSLTKEEMETVILTNATAKTWDVTTADPKFIRYLTRRGYEMRKMGDGPYLRTKIPFGDVRVLKANRQKRPMNPRNLHSGGSKTDQPAKGGL